MPAHPHTGLLQELVAQVGALGEAARGLGQVLQACFLTPHQKIEEGSKCLTTAFTRQEAVGGLVDMISQAFCELVLMLVDTGAPARSGCRGGHLVVSSRWTEDMVKVPSTSVSRSRWMVELWPRLPMPSLLWGNQGVPT